MAASQPLLHRSRDETYFSRNEFLSTLYEDVLGAYGQLRESQNPAESLVDIFFPPLGEAVREQNTEAGAGEEPDGNGESRAVSGEAALLQETNSIMESNLATYSNNLSTRWESNFLAIDTATGRMLGNPREDWLALANGTLAENERVPLENGSLYCAVLSFDENGELTLPYLYGGDSNTLTVLKNRHWEIQNQLFSYTSGPELTVQTAGLLQTPKNFTCVFQIPATISSYNWNYVQYNNHNIGVFHNSGYVPLYWLAAAAALLTGFWMGRRKKWELGSLRLFKIPAEPAALLGILGIFLLDNAASPLGYTFQGMFLLDPFMSVAAISLPYFLGVFINYACTFLFLFAAFAALFTASISLTQITTLGWRAYLHQRTLLFQGWQLAKKWFRRFAAWLFAVDLTDSSNKILIKLLGVNFVILAIIAIIWVAGIAVAVVYTIFLFIFLQRYYKKWREQYTALLETTRRMAEGNFQAAPPEELGIFDPLKEELLKVQDGFERAVVAETKSQNMKAELITNVSHDLKTPLTAIITYINLLQDESITEEERRSYVDTLDIKSQRLKHLIEDLFEMSKASSRDITLNLSSVDLPALIRQVELEERVLLDEAQITFLYQFPPEKVALILDGGKTSRIFQNLMQNIAKYALPGTRAYVELRRLPGEVEVALKNISRDALEFDNGQITERFVRGDLSRNTEGSGLGLAIAKSFAEAQGGRFRIETDGDLFKAIVVFPDTTDTQAASD